MTPRTIRHYAKEIARRYKYLCTLHAAYVDRWAVSAMLETLAARDDTTIDLQGLQEAPEDQFLRTMQRIRAEYDYGRGRLPAGFKDYCVAVSA